MAKITREDALEYHHLKGKPGKIAVVPTKPMDTQRDLSLAYTPGVAEPVPALAVNVTRKESDLTPVKIGDIPEILGVAKIEVARARDELQEKVKQHRIGRPLAEVCLWMALLVAIAELLVANRSSRKAGEFSDRLAVAESGRVRGKKHEGLSGGE